MIACRGMSPYPASAWAVTDRWDGMHFRRVGVRGSYARGYFSCRCNCGLIGKNLLQANRKGRAGPETGGAVAASVWDFYPFHLFASVDKERSHFPDILTGCDLFLNYKLRTISYNILPDMKINGINTKRPTILQKSNDKKEKE